MDSDGEDDPKKIKDIIKLIDKNPNIETITMKRTLRKESFFFSILYEIHLIVTILFTLKYIRFGNFSFLNKRVINEITKKKELWLAYSATLKKYFNTNNSISAPRRKRISGKSKMSYFGLIIHSLNIQAVFMKNILILYVFYFFLFLYMFNFLTLTSVLLLFFIAHFLILIFNVKKKNNGITFNNCLNNIRSIKKIN